MLKSVASKGSAWRPAFRISLQIAGICSLAIAQPLFSLLSQNPTFFVAHAAGAEDVILFTILVIVLPTMLLAIPIGVIQVISPLSARLLVAGAVGLLTTLAIFAPIGAMNDLDGAQYIAAIGGGTAIFASLFVGSKAVRLFTLYLSPAPILVAALFLFGSPIRSLVFARSPDVLSAIYPLRTPTVVVVFDELPLGALLGTNGRIESSRFPGFARLAKVSSWYPMATTVAPWTNLAVPAILTGRLPDPKRPPVAGQYPRSLFTMLGASHGLYVAERTTSLCPRTLCEEAMAEHSAPASLTRDTAIVVLHQILRTSLAQRWLPPISGSWANFGSESGPEPVRLPDEDAELEFAEWRARLKGSRHPSRSFATFIASVVNDQHPGLWYQHEMLPHMPYRYLPDGRTYHGDLPGGLSADLTYWSNDPLASINARQRMLLQLGYVDMLINRLLDRLQEQGMFRETLLIVVADHGISFDSGGHRRGVFHRVNGTRTPVATADLAGNAGDDVLPIPLFVKYPGQTTGAIDYRRAETIDVLPTIADTLGVNLPHEWSFDGRSLRGEPRSGVSGHWITGGATERRFSFAVNPLQMAMEIRRLFGPGGGPHDLYAVGPHGQLVGRSVNGLRASPIAGAAVVASDSAAYNNLDREGQSMPVLYVGHVSGVELGSWLAVALNGTVAGLGPVYRHRDGYPVVEVMLDPALMVNGANRVEVFLVDSGSSRMREIAAE